MSEFIWIPSYSTSLKRKPRIQKAQFGGGYAQRVGDGINNNPQVWNLVFTNISPAVAEAIDAFLSTAGGTTPFDWTPPGKSAAKFVCEEWSIVADSYGGWNGSALFEQDFAL